MLSCYQIYVKYFCKINYIFIATKKPWSMTMAFKRQTYSYNEFVSSVTLGPNVDAKETCLMYVPLTAAGRNLAIVS